MIAVGERPFPKGGEILPLFADCNAALSVIFERFMTRITTSGQHIAPNVIQTRSPSAMSCENMLGLIYPETAARFCIAGSEIVPLKNVCVAAVALALPNGISAPVALVPIGPLDNEQPSKLLACEIDQAGHNDVKPKELQLCNRF